MNTLDDLVLIIRKNDFLDKLTASDMDQLNIVHNYMTVEKDAHIYFYGDNANKLFFLKEGFVKIGSVDNDGEELIKDILQPGDVFGQITLERSAARDEFAKAHKAAVTLCAFTLRDFEKLLELRPDLAIAYSRKIGAKVIRMEHRLLNLLYKDVRTRLLYFFWTLAQKQATASESVKLTNYLTHGDIARLTGSSRQTVTAHIRALTEEGILKIDRRTIEIHDIKRLKAEARVG
jgi:CRP/FNR family transcriptional regulator, cyclic AMP receptor protein